MQLAETFPVGGDISGIAHRDVELRRRPTQLLDDLERRRLLSLDAEGVDRIDERNAGLLGDLSDHLKRSVEGAADKNDVGAVRDRLRQLAGRNAACWHHYDGVQPAGGGIRRRRRAGIAGRRAEQCLRTGFHGLCGGDSHTAILERAGWIEGFVLEIELPEPDGWTDLLRLDEWRRALAERNPRRRLANRQIRRVTLDDAGRHGGHASVR